VNAPAIRGTEHHAITSTVLSTNRLAAAGTAARAKAFDAASPLATRSTTASMALVSAPASRIAASYSSK